MSWVKQLGLRSLHLDLEMGLPLVLSGHECMRLSRSSQELHLGSLLQRLPAVNFRPSSSSSILLAAACDCPVVRVEVQGLEGFSPCPAVPSFPLRRRSPLHAPVPSPEVVYCCLALALGSCCMYGVFCCSFPPQSKGCTCAQVLGVSLPPSSCLSYPRQTILPCM